MPFRLISWDGSRNPWRHGDSGETYRVSWHLDRELYWLSELTSCFHGRDIAHIRDQYTRNLAFRDELASVPRDVGKGEGKASVPRDAGPPQMPEFRLADDAIPIR